MKFWHFHFEGKFNGGDSKNAGLVVFSSCLVPQSDFEVAQTMFLMKLKRNFIDLVEVIESFDVNGEELDPSDPVNTFWIDWYKRCRLAKEPILDVLHVIDE
jgi:hypothetical protein